MRTCNWYRFILLCVLIAILLVLVNFTTAPPPDPCICDCTPLLERQRAELRVTHEYEIEAKEKRIKQLEAATAPPVTDKLESGHRLAVIVPFRNRHEELQDFIPHMHHFLTRQHVAHEIWVINQADSYRFNRASLLNIGFLLGQDRCDYIVMHDVDLLPANDELKYSYPASGPYHISSPSLHPLYHYKTFVGGVLSLTREHFKQVNGLSNQFWGWGREDDEFYLRMKEARMIIHYPTGITTGYDTFRHNHDKEKRPRDQKSYYSQQTKSVMKDRSTGLNTIQYKVISRVNMTIDNAPFYFVNVHLYCDPDFTPNCINKPK